MATLKNIARLMIGGVEHIAYGGRVMPVVAGGAHTIEDYESRQTEISSRLQEIDAEFAGQALPDATRQEWNELNEERESNTKLIDELRARRERVEALSANPESREDGATFHTPRPGQARGGDIYDLSTVRSSMTSPSQAADELRDRAMRATDNARFRHPDVDQDGAKAHVEGLLGRDSEDSRLARYILAVGSPTYKRAFGKYLASRSLSREEQAAMELAQTAERAMSLAGASGGFAVPFELDPTILNTSNGVVNPIRQVARVEQITTDEWRGVSSAGVTASYAAEASEVGDNSPTLGQPTVSTEKAHSFIQFSIEVGQDWTGLQAQMAVLLQEARDQLEAAKFVSGSGVNEPFGVLTGTTNTVNAAAGADAFTLANLYALKGALPPRYRAQGVFMADSLIYDRVRQFDTVGSSAAVWVDSLQDDNPPRLLGKSAYEASEMPDNALAGNKFLLYGDFSRYLIVDRVGLTIEVVPHIVGVNRRPTGERGIYAYWRNGAKVLDANAFRAIIGTA